MSLASWKSGDGVSDQFPAGLRVLVVDDDTTCLRILEKMLTTCLYQVTKCSRAEVALKTLRDKKDGFDIVISDVHMPDMDGFKLLEHIGLEMDLPVIMMSADDSKKVVMKGVKHGACDYLIKPVHMEALKTIWQHVVRRKRHEWEEKDNEQSGSVGDGERVQNKQSEDDSSEGSWKSSKKRKDEDDEGEERDDSSSSKKPRVVWTTELHQQFVTAVNQLGIDKAVPKKILELMNIPGITRENVASHLQKYRQYLKKLSGQQQNGLANSFVAHHDPTFGSLSGLDNYRPFSSSVQLQPQNFATNKPLMSSVGPGNPRNIFTYENPKIRFVEGQQQHNNKRVNLVNGIPTTMEPRVYGNMNTPLHTRSTPFQTQMIQQQQQQPRTQFLNDVTLNIPSAVFGQNGIAAPPAYACTDFSTNQAIDHLPGATAFSNSGIELSPEMNGLSRGFVTNYDVYNDLGQNNRTDDWGMQSVGSNFEHTNSSNGDDFSRMKSGMSPEVGFQNGLCLDHQFGGEDLMSTLLKQTQEDPVTLDGEFSFDGFQLDPV